MRGGPYRPVGDESWLAGGLAMAHGIATDAPVPGAKRVRSRCTLCSCTVYLSMTRQTACCRGGATRVAESSRVGARPVRPRHPPAAYRALARATTVAWQRRRMPTGSNCYMSRCRVASFLTTGFRRFLRALFINQHITFN